ncbi:MAG: FecR domain-containing protein [Opitutaceae bacterium]|nr:FecR domain-containing protein [Opitutaceae bacterium]
MKPEKPSSLHLDDEAIHWATRLDGGDLTPDERARLDAWLAGDPAGRWRLAHYQQFYAQLHGTLPAMAAAGALDPVTVPAARPRRFWLRAAAGIGVAAVLALAGVWWSQRPLRLVTTTAQRQSVTLSDGTRTDLNARTVLTVAMHRARREVHLEQGEAVFTVTKDVQRPFFVLTAAGTVRVVGTQFNVRAAPSGVVTVTVLEGRVAVQPVDVTGRELPPPPLLVAGDRLRIDPATGGVQTDRPQGVEDVTAWREGRVVFLGTPLGEALERFADYHDRSLTAAPEAATLSLGGRYTLDDLDHFLASLERALPVRVLPTSGGGLRVVVRAR